VSENFKTGFFSGGVESEFFFILQKKESKDGALKMNECIWLKRVRDLFSAK
jgi:hypothetical protein